MQALGPSLTATELARAVGRAMDDLEDQVVPVTRHGKVVAILRPVQETAFDQFQARQFDTVSTSDISAQGAGPTLERVRAGEPVTITRYNRPTAVLESVDRWEELHGQLARLDDRNVLGDDIAVAEGATGVEGNGLVADAETVARGILQRLRDRLGADDPLVRATAADLAGLVAFMSASRGGATPVAAEHAGLFDLDD